MSDPNPAAQIPGMVEPIELDLLLDASRSLRLAHDEIVCEFGSYLGRSTRAIAQGLSEQLGRVDRPRPMLHAFDLFACDAKGILAHYLVRDAERTKVAHLLQHESGRIDFRGVFEHFLAGLPAGLLAVHQTPLSAARHPGGNIAMMHVDAPKWYAEYRQVLSEFGPHLKPGALIVFQDFFYHWAAELIAAIEYGVQKGWFEPLETAASSLLVRATRPVAVADLDALDQALQDPGLDKLVHQAAQRYDSFELDRPQVFLPRLYLAGMQNALQANETDRAAEWLMTLAGRFGGALPKPAVADLAELVGYGFSVRRLYDLDCGAEASNA